MHTETELYCKKCQTETKHNREDYVRGDEVVGQCWVCEQCDNDVEIETGDNDDYEEDKS